MTREMIPFEALKVDIFNLWDNQWWVLSAGDFATGKYNSMTVSWGALGIMWNKPFALVVVRPTRYTYQFIENYSDYSLCTFGEKYRFALEYFGSHSGRNGDKIQPSGLTPQAASRITAPLFEEAELCLECRKIYSDDYDPKRFLDVRIEELYPQKDYHRIYFGEVVAITGLAKYRAAC